MDLFLAIRIHDDPLYLPVALERLIRSELPGPRFFQLDNQASPELVRTAQEAVRRSDRVILFLETTNSGEEINKLMPVFRNVVLKGESMIWIESGPSDHPLLHRMVPHRHQVNGPEEVIAISKVFLK